MHHTDSLLDVLILIMWFLIRHSRQFLLVLITITFSLMWYKNLEFIYNKVVAHTGYGNLVNQKTHSALTTKELSFTILKIQEQQMCQNMNASFLLETHDLLVTIKLRPRELIKKHAQWKYYGRSQFHDFLLILRCYEFNNQIATKNELFNVTFSLRNEVDITSNGKFKSLHLNNVTLFNTIALLIVDFMVCPTNIDVMDEQITVPARFLMSNSSIYRFSLELIHSRTDHKTQVFLNWPQWPLPTLCLQEIMRDLSNKNSNQHLLSVTPLNYSCTVTDSLSVPTTHSRFVQQQTAIAQWLDLQNGASDINPSASMFQTITKRKEKQIAFLSTIRRLHPFEKSFNTSMCSAPFKIWIKEYHEWHLNTSRILMQMQMNFTVITDHIRRHNTRFLMYRKTSGDHGASDGIVHLISTYLIAILTRRFFVFDRSWPELERVYHISLNTLPDIMPTWLPEVLRLNQTKNLTSLNSTYISARAYTFGTERYARDYKYDIEFPEHIVIMDGFTGNVVHTISSSTSMYSKFLKNDLKMTEENLFGCLYHSLMIPRIESLIQMTSESDKKTNRDYRPGYTYREILQILISLNFHSIGLQIRVGDDSFANGSQLRKDRSFDGKLIGKYKHFFSCARELVDTYKQKNVNSLSIDYSESTVVFLASDNMQLRRAALRRWRLPHICLNKSVQQCSTAEQSINLIATTNILEHSAHATNKLRALQNVMMETFLFSLCQEHIFSTASGFGRVPAFTALNFRNIYSFMDRNRPSCSQPENGMKLETSAHHQAGI